MMTEARWLRLMQSLQLPESMDTFDALRSAYNEKQRYYHTAAHIDDCLERLDEAVELADRPAEIEIALWFHDAVYKPMRSDNEERSADWARDFLLSGEADSNTANRVHGYIMDTCHEASPGAGDAALLVDIDLSILGRDAATFDRFEQNVRREYKWVPGPMFRRKRAEILESFLVRDTIYATAYFHNRYEASARRNLENAIAALRG